MRYIDHGNGGPPSVMKLAEGPKPSLKPGEVLIEVAYAGVNRPDVLQRSGSYPPPPGASPLLGLEVAGRIVEVAADVTEWKVGDTVCALTPGGGYAEFCATPAAHCLPIPKGLSAKEAASLPENWFTVYDNVMTRGRLKAGETILIHGGSGGIGYSAIQLAKVLGGATVYTTVGSAEKAAFCRKMGADVALNYKDEDWAAEVAKLTGKRGVDVVLDMVGGDYLMRNIRSLALEGAWCRSPSSRRTRSPTSMRCRSCSSGSRSPARPCGRAPSSRRRRSRSRCASTSGRSSSPASSRPSSTRPSRSPTRALHTS